VSGGGKHIIRYSQSELAYLFGIGHVESSGVCAAMSAMYLLKRSKNENFWTWMKTVKGRTTLINIHGSGKSANKYMDEVYKLLKEMTWVGSVNEIPVSQLDDYLTTERPPTGNGDYIWFSVYVGATLFSAGGGHAMAFQRAPEIRFMDPNYGEYEFTSLDKDFLPWLERHIVDHYKWAIHGKAEIQYMDKK